jgi:hypothetical protein
MYARGNTRHFFSSLRRKKCHIEIDLFGLGGEDQIAFLDMDNTSVTTDSTYIKEISYKYKTIFSP